MIKYWPLDQPALGKPTGDENSKTGSETVVKQTGSSDPPLTDPSAGQPRERLLIPMSVQDEPICGML
jgi:hypothetical protein